MVAARGLRVAAMPYTGVSPNTGDRAALIEEWNAALRACRVRNKEREVAVSLADDPDFMVNSRHPTVPRVCILCGTHYDLNRWAVTSGYQCHLCPGCKAQR